MPTSTNQNPTKVPKRSKDTHHAQGRAKGEEAEDEEDEEEEEQLSKTVIGVIPAWFVSLVVHSILILFLMFFTLTTPVTKVVEVVSVEEPEEELEEVTEIELEDLEIEELEEPAAKAEAIQVVADIPSFEVPTSDALEVASLASEFEGFDAMVNEGEMTDIGETPGEGEAVFFGTKAVAKRVIFIVDNSNSMGGGRLETALIELQRAINSLSPKQRFYIIFYSDTAYPLFYPKPVSNLVPATDANKNKVQYWLGSIEMCLRTDIRDSIRLARQLNPDLVYILGDAAFNTSELDKNPLKGVTIHTLGMNVAQKDQGGFKKIANRHNGKYTDVGVSKMGFALYKRAGSRPRNNKKGPIWGIKLPK